MFSILYLKSAEISPAPVPRVPVLKKLVPVPRVPVRDWVPRSTLAGIVFWVQIDEHGHTFSTELPSAIASPGQVCVGPKTYYLQNVIRLKTSAKWTVGLDFQSQSHTVPQTYWRGSPMGLIEIFIIEFDYFWIDFTGKCNKNKFILEEHNFHCFKSSFRLEKCQVYVIFCINSGTNLF